MVFTAFTLPISTKFKSAFGLEYDNTAQYYFVNKTLHEKLQADTFALRNPARQSSAGDITLPYAAFDLVAQYPLTLDGSLRYFPLARDLQHATHP